MRLKLEDNTQEALQFLLLGAAIVFAFRLVIGGVGLWLESGTEDELVRAASAYRNNFLLRDGRTVVIGGMEIFGRLSMAFLLALVAGVLGSLITAAIARSAKKPIIPAAVQGARLGLILVFAMGLYSALFLPARAMRVTPEGALMLHRPSLPGGFALPVPADEQLIPWEIVEDIQTRSRAAGMQGCGVHEEVVLQTGSTHHVIASNVPTGANCDRVIGHARDTAQRLARILQKDKLNASLQSH